MIILQLDANETFTWSKPAAEKTTSTRFVVTLSLSFVLSRPLPLPRSPSLSFPFLFLFSVFLTVWYCLSSVWAWFASFLGSGSKGADDVGFHLNVFFSFSVHPLRNLYPSLKAQIPTSRLKSQTRGSNLIIEAHIPASRLISQTWGSNSSLEAQIQTLNSSLKAKIPVSWLISQPWGSNHSLDAQVTSSRLKSHYWCSNSSLKPQNLLFIGHRPLWGCCPSNYQTSIPSCSKISSQLDKIIIHCCYFLYWIIFFFTNIYYKLF